jgi:UDP-N-acetyl-D-glucosamine dehydrogenase
MRNWQNIKAMQSTPLTKEFLAAQDCILIATDHSAYDYNFIVANSNLIVDSRNATKNVKNGQNKIVKS